MSQKGSDYTIPETAAGAPRAGGSGLGLRHRRACTLAVVHAHRPNLLYPRPPASQYAGGSCSRRPGPSLAVARAARASGSRELLASFPDAGLWEVRGLDSRRLRRYVQPEVLCFVGPAQGSGLQWPRQRYQVERGVPWGGNRK